MEARSTMAGQYGNRRDAEAIDRHAAEWFARLLDENATVLNRTEFRAWLEADTRHAAAYAELERLWSGAGFLPEIAETKHRRRSLLKAGGAAVVLLAAGATGFRLLSDGAGDYRTSVGETATVTLPDGSVVELSTATAISLEYSAGERVVTLEHGQAYFIVAADRARPFRVKSGALTTTALGTEFSVAMLDDTIEVAVSKHAVSVVAPAESRKVLEGETVVFDNNRLSDPVAADLESALAWRSGKLVFISTPLQDAVSAIGRWRRGKVIVMDEQLARRPISIIVDVKRTSNVLKNLQDGLPIRVVTLSPWLAFVYPR